MSCDAVVCREVLARRSIAATWLMILVRENALYSTNMHSIHATHYNTLPLGAARRWSAVSRISDPIARPKPPGGIVRRIAAAALERILMPDPRPRALAGRAGRELVGFAA